MIKRLWNFASHSDGYMYALDPRGYVEWRYREQSSNNVNVHGIPGGAILGANGNLYYGNSVGSLYSLFAACPKWLPDEYSAPATG
jgi:outer membrane protein assembly factor BamB